MAPRRDPLREYRAKRPAGRSPEPGGALPGREAAAPSGGGLFVIHQHAARRLHYDLRLEWDGVLKSWAVPKGPALDPAEKRLAVHVEDHPIEYAEFEGLIPEGSYGAGAMILWDRGVWIPEEDPEEGLVKGKLLFELRGHKLRGVWTLVRLKKTENEWLMIRERRGREEEATQPADADDLPAESVFSGLTVEELAAHYDPAPAIHERLVQLAAPRRTLAASQVSMMLARRSERPFSKSGWIFELKLDGYRMLAAKTAEQVALVTRNGNDATATFPDVTAALRALPYDRFILDGEVVVHDETGLPSFQALQKRARLARSIDIRRSAHGRPATFYAFDLVAACGFDLRPLPLVERKRVLKDLLPPVGPIRYVEHFAERGEELYARVRALGLEGIVGKAADSRYRGGRSNEWIKVRADQTDDFVVVGYTQPRGTRTELGALHLAAYRDGELIYAGRVGSGLTEGDLGSLGDLLARQRRNTPACGGNAPAGRQHHWVEPDLVCEVRYHEWTEDGLLRQPVFLRIREDRDPGDCVLPPHGSPAEDDADPFTDVADAEPPEVRVTNPEKVFWPDEGHTKRDLADYYRRIAPWLLPYLRDRPLVLTRYPDGIAGKSFYQKNAPGFVPDWVRTVRIPSESSERDLEYIVCDDLATLLYVANLGAIPLHVWASRVVSLDAPDWCILDLDPKGAPFENVVEVARSIYKLCNEIEFPSFVKTSGSTGLHVLLPLDGRVDYEGSRALGELLARVVVAKHPGVATIERVVSARAGKVYVDYLQNRRGQLLVAPFSARPITGAPVSTPLRWREVRADLDIGRFTIASVPRRVTQMNEDPMRSVLTETPDLPRALERLLDRMKRAGGSAGDS